MLDGKGDSLAKVESLLTASLTAAPPERRSPSSASPKCPPRRRKPEAALLAKIAGAHAYLGEADGKVFAEVGIRRPARKLPTAYARSPRAAAW